MASSSAAARASASSIAAACQSHFGLAYVSISSLSVGAEYFLLVVRVPSALFDPCRIAEL